MKFGMRKPNIKKSLRARTTGKIKRSMNSTINPLYGKKGIGYIRNPQKTIKNKIYHKTTFSIMDVFNWVKPKKSIKVKYDNKEFYITNKKEANLMAEQWIKVAQESANITNTTKVPKVFFERYDLMIQRMELLVKTETFLSYKNKPSDNLKEILEKKEITINDFIDRYYKEIRNKIESLKTVNSKNNYIEKFKNELEIYIDKMNENNICYFMQLYNKLKNI